MHGPNPQECVSHAGQGLAVLVAGESGSLCDLGQQGPRVNGYMSVRAGPETQNRFSDVAVA